MQEVTEQTKAFIENIFGFHPATDETRASHENVRQFYIDFAKLICSYVPDGRERSLMMTHLQESALHAQAGIAFQAPLVLPGA